ncbi:MAG: flagellar biosynthesis protein FliQ [Anaerolineaceae bacterium]|nr:flagellar biosynthesis protein FliQ [Anaerolineaceae bacterium]
MDENFVISFGMEAMLMIIYLTSPILLVSLVIGSVVSLFQAATQVNEITLTFVPKILGIILVLMFLGSWMLQQIMAFTTSIFMSLPDFVK